ncbi:MAG: hypothetical protein IIZ27_04010 [Solobacterium sp.]|nr:hypothetical protein [Solobacterium sp.]
MNQPTLKDRFQYWFDNHMSKGGMALFRILIIFSVLLILLLTGLMVLTGLVKHPDGNASVFWDTLITMFNAWFPSFEDGYVSEETFSAGYLILNVIAAIVGLLLTSVLIGIITSAIEEKIMSLRKGTSIVLEENHTIVLGFYPGEYTLINQLILAAAGKPCTIVVAEDMEKDELEQYIRDNIDVPNNIKIICRTADICDPADLEKLAPEKARVIIISPTTDERTVKSLLAVSMLINDDTHSKVRVGAIVSSDDYRFPPTIASKHNVTTLQTNNTLAKIIAHSCTQPGLSEVFREIFNFEGSELYNVTLKDIAGLTFEELSYGLEKAVPIGILRNEKAILNPPADTVLKEEDTIFIFAEDKYNYHFQKKTLPNLEHVRDTVREEPQAGKILILGENSSLGIVLSELPENAKEVVVAGLKNEEQKEIVRYLERISPELSISIDDSNLKSIKNLTYLTEDIDHIVILSDYSEEEEKADMQNIFYLLHLRDIRTTWQRNYNITAEMRRERNQSLVVTGDSTDFVVASNMSSLFLAQLAESPELYAVFRELLSNEGNEIFLKNAENMHCTGTYTVAELRLRTLVQNYIFIGYRIREEEHCVFNPGLNDEITLTENDSVIVIGEH